MFLRQPSLEQYHMDLHERVSPIIVQLFNDTPVAKPSLIAEIDSVNEDLRRMNGERSLAAEMGTIDIGVFLYSWEHENTDESLSQFCKKHSYPIGWARRPPMGGREYQARDLRDLEEDYWRLPGILLSAIWQLRKAKATAYTVQEQEMVLLELEDEFNICPDPSSGQEIRPLRSQPLLDLYRELANYLAAGDQEPYEGRRETLRRKCVLGEYPETWVPGPYNDEKQTA
ncbi:uncharacterized protein LDX57_008661 [Aspergillus melleus]|uniref:uncharacterized protein n=1 Tax=Aspergillus melleus TaxID=138277 RepID=UPI001E8DF871|nr:uncharacterized protein LDX57_008661 [Aspergillus melleus]KAH8431000.1 hypothetical protein LDX57_008661 [Aspergillus melleus]